MFKLKVILLACFSFTFCVSAFGDDLQTARSLHEANDDLGLRIQMRKIFKNSKSVTQYKQIRKILNRSPRVGYDLLFAWEQKMQQVLKLSPQEKKINDLISSANKNSLENKFAVAFTEYQTAAQLVKSASGSQIARENKQLYYYLLHQMARAAYSGGQYESALTVYSWIPKLYYQYRAIQFEKMWAGYRAEKYDVALGAVIAQQSKYFSRYLDPESYLLKLYILKKFCREDDVKRTVAEIKSYISDLENKKITTSQWAKMDIDTLSLFYLLKDRPNVSPRMDLISEDLRRAEKAKIKRYLEKRKIEDFVRIEAALKKVLGYSLIMKAGSRVNAKSITDLPDSKILSEQGIEFWPVVSQGEEWIDELGSLYYIGTTECK